MLIIFKADISICLSRIRVISNHGHSGWQPHRLQLGQWHNATTIKEKYLQIISGWYIRFNNGTWHILALVVASKGFSFFFSAISLQRWIIGWRSMLLNFISYIISFFLIHIASMYPSWKCSLPSLSSFGHSPTVVSRSCDQSCFCTAQVRKYAYHISPWRQCWE